jgi:hypothetical protein
VPLFEGVPGRKIFQRPVFRILPPVGVHHGRIQLESQQFQTVFIEEAGDPRQRKTLLPSTMASGTGQ